MHDRLARWISTYGGRSSGKSYTVCLLVIIECLISERFIVVARDYKDDVEYSIWRNLTQRIHELELNDFFKIRKESIVCTLTNTQIIPFGLLDNPDKIKSLEGCDLLIMEESAKVPTYVWDKVVPTIRKKQSQILAIFNPDWINDETYQRLVVNREQLKSGYFSRLINYTDNHYNSNETILDAEADKEKDYKKYKNIWLGEPKDTSDFQVFGVVYVIDDFNFDDKKQFTDYINDSDFEDITLYVGLSLGISQMPSCFVRCFEYKNFLYIDRCQAQQSTNIIDLVNLCRDVFFTYSECRMLIDNRYEKTAQRFEFEFSKTLNSHDEHRGFAQANTWKNDDLDTIFHLRNKYEKIIIHKDCLEAIECFEKFSWLYDEKEEHILSVYSYKYSNVFHALRFAISEII